MKKSEAKSKILCILHTPPPIHGAAMVGKYIRDSKYLNNAFDIDYVNLSTSISLDKIGKGGGLKLFAIFKIQLKVLWALISRKYELCYLTLTAKGAGFYKDLFIVALLKLFGKNIIYHFHNQGVRESSASRLNRSLYRFTFNNTQSILLSSKLYEDIAPFVKEDNIHYCANGIPEIENYSKTSEERSINGQFCRILLLSNMMQQKGVFELLEICKILIARKIRFECHFVGAWSDVTKEEFEILITQNGLSNVVFGHGPKYREEKFTFLDQSDIFVFPSYDDCFPLVLLEAMQCGLPIVSSGPGGVPDILIHEETGFIIQEIDAEMFADKIEVLIKNPDLRSKMGENGKNRFNELFTLDIFENRMLNVWQDAIVRRIK